MSTPMTANQWLNALHVEGVATAIPYGDWRTLGRDAATGKTFGPVHGVTIHHTAGADSLAVVHNGTGDLPGPLCHGHLPKSGRVNMISTHRANHAGTFAQNAHDAVLAESTVHPTPDRAEPVDGNDHYYGLEIENRGDGDDAYPWVQYVAAVKWATAICRFHGWSENSVIGHREGTTRKIDPKGPVTQPDGDELPFHMNQFRIDVRDALDLPAGAWGTDQEDEVALTAAEIKEIWHTPELIPAVAPPYENSDWADGQTTWTPKYALYAAVRASREAQERTERIEAKVATLSSQVAAVAADVSGISTGGVDLDALAVKVANEIYKRMAG